LGIRDFIGYLREHRLVAEKPEMLSDAEREEILRQAEVMVGMADAAVKELESVVNNRRVNLPKSTPSALPRTSFSTSGTRKKASRRNSAKVYLRRLLRRRPPSSSSSSPSSSSPAQPAAKSSTAAENSPDPA
jgi:hypothetical protein